MGKPRTLDVGTDAHKVPTKVSRRASAARVRRTTLLIRHNLYDDEVDKILDAVEDGSPSYSTNTYADSAQTPKAKPGTAGTLLSTVKRTIPRPSFDIEQHERAIDERGVQDSLPDEDGHSEAEDEDYYEGHSITLRDILLKATDVNGAPDSLLGEAGDDLDDEAFEW
ncbi:uncharacterized protein B0H18DRAFT_1115438 [Fomitopsis serialis]|uniref:uncharacterized protein n=1 Tax=Fomitopsis serialis TaxID=139415 RepID=UPI0020072616|nr:uncharacterized protein B0H18DRAFT_1115438 [Neoantrodia serialis]KAH9933437.1 hypothetical protein B0H18DRAFT_1115438 [Neoantrodia serialis]